jgi:acylphosphatase
MKPLSSARRWLVSGRVQGVGFRWFVQKNATDLGLKGWVRNEADGDVQVYAMGTPAQLDALAGLLHQGPRLSHVRSVDQQDAVPGTFSTFEIR